MTGVAVGLDFAAVMAVAAAQGADLELMADTLPDFETAILNGLAGEEDED